VDDADPEKPLLPAFLLDAELEGAGLKAVRQRIERQCDAQGSRKLAKRS
jgi:hypothetical protein